MIATALHWCMLGSLVLLDLTATASIEPAVHAHNLLVKEARQDKGSSRSEDPSLRQQSASQKQNTVMKFQQMKHSSLSSTVHQTLMNENPVTYDFTIKQKDFCAKDVFLLIVVCSAVENIEQREVIRNTWGEAARTAKTKAQVVFLLGTPPEDSQGLQELVSMETEHYQDIIQESLVDSYENLSYKSIAMLHWISVYCSHVKYVLKTDDDMYINTDMLLHDLLHSVHTKFIMGDIIAGAQPIRDRGSKWYTPVTVFSGVRYPKYVSGCAYVISGDLVEDLYKATFHTNFFWLEDVYITGLCARYAGAQHIFNAKFGYRRRTLDPCLFRLVITGHRLTPREMYAMWMQVNRTDLKCKHTPISTVNN